MTERTPAELVSFLVVLNVVVMGALLFVLIPLDGLVSVVPVVVFLAVVLLLYLLRA